MTLVAALDSGRAAPQLALLAGCAAALFFLGLGGRELSSSHEARAAQNAQSLLDEGDWLLPRRFDRRPELQKPPLYYWLVAVIASVSGGAVDAWAVRLPAACSAFGCVLLLFLTGRSCGRPLAGLLAALVLASSLHFTWLARVGRIDMPLTFAVTLACCCFHLGTHTEKRGRRLAWQIGGYTALALGVLLKGPIAVVLAALIAAAVHLTRAGLTWRALTPDGSLLWGVPWLLLLAGPWFLCANLRTDGRLWHEFFWHHNVERGLGGSETLAAHPWWLYVPLALKGLLPWSVAAPVLAWRLRRAAPDAEGRAGLAWFTVIFAFLSCMSFKRADYLLPAFPGFALWLGCAAERCWQSLPASSDSRWSLTRVRAARLFAGLVGVCVLGWGLGAAWVMARSAGDGPCRQIAHEIRRRTEAPVIFFRAEAHQLAFHVGKPLDTILEWENLEVWATLDCPIYVVMPADCAAVWPAHLRRGRLHEVLRTSASGHDRPLVVLRSPGKMAPGP